MGSGCLSLGFNFLFIVKCVSECFLGAVGWSVSIIHLYNCWSSVLLFFISVMWKSERVGWLFLPKCLSRRMGLGFVSAVALMSQPW